MPQSSTLLADIQSLAATTIERRRDFHRHPELGMEEVRTSGRVAEVLRGLGLEVKTGVAKTGVIGLLRGDHAGSTVLLRADMDGLPVQETGDHEYASVNAGVMHACGHDAHVAMLLTAAEVLSRHKDRIRGAVKFMFQPAEEGPGGAMPMIEEGLLEDPKVDAALAFHVWNNLPAGQIGVRNGPCFASTDQFDLIVTGRSGHGAMPHLSVDAIVVAANVVTALQSIVSRQVSPVESAVVTIGTIAGGDRHNIICERVKMEGTVRTFSRELRDEMQERITRTAQGVARALGGDCEVIYDRGYPVTANDPAISDAVRAAATRVVGAENVLSQEATMGAEDMSYVLERVPGCYFMVGTANPGRGLDNPHHHHAFDIEESALAPGAHVMAEAALEVLDRLASG